MAASALYRNGAKLRTRQRLLPTAGRQRRLNRSEGRDLVYRLTYNDDVAAGQLAVFQGASDEHI